MVIFSALLHLQRKDFAISIFSETTSSQPFPFTTCLVWKTQTTSSSRMHLHVVKTSSSENIFSNCQSYKKKMFKRSAKLTTSALLCFQTLCDHVDIFDVMTSACSNCNFFPVRVRLWLWRGWESVHVCVVLQRDICIEYWVLWGW